MKIVIDDDNRELICSCGSNYLHQGTVEVFGREREDGAVTGFKISITPKEGECPVDEGQLGMTMADPARNPSDRRQGLLISFYCEECANEPTLAIYQDRGNTHIEWIDFRRTPQTPSEPITASKLREIIEGIKAR